VKDITKTLHKMKDLHSTDEDPDLNARIDEKEIKVAAVAKRLGFDDRNPKNLSIICRYVARMALNAAKRGLFVTGDTGTGKTFALMLIAERCKIKRRDAGYVTAQEFSNLVSKEGSYNAVKKFTTDLKAEAWHQGRWDTHSYEFVDLIIDDVGAENEAIHFGRHSESLVELIAARYDLWRERGVRTHFTSNLTTDQIEERYGKRIASRIFEMCWVTKFEGNDRRKER
jgi:DNA replication protein DnaC